MQVYNQMRQAELLRREGGQRERVRPYSNRVNAKPQGRNALSSLLSYPSPKNQAKNLTGGLQPYASGSAAEYNGAGYPLGDASRVSFGRDRSTNILVDARPQEISPIPSVGSGYSEGQVAHAGYPGGIAAGHAAIAHSTKLLSENAARGTYQLSVTPLHKVNALALAPAKSAAAMLHEQNARQSGVLVPARAKEAVGEPAGDRRVDGIHVSKGNLDFETRRDTKGRMTIAVSRGRQSKFHERGTPREYPLCVLDEQELSVALSTNYRRECKQLERIQEAKKVLGHSTFVEDVHRLPFQLTCQRERDEKKRRKMDIARKIQEDRETELDNRRHGRLPMAPVQAARTEDQQKPAGAGLGHNFDYMNIDELKQHENGILNLFEGERHMAQYDSHNKIDAKTGKSKSYVRLSQYEYDTIFERDPSFNEKKAFVDVFRRKWREDKGYCSMFDKRSNYKLAQSKSIETLTRQQQLTASIKARVQR